MPPSKHMMDLCAPKFSMGDNPTFFIEKFELVAKISKWDEEQKCVQLCLNLPKEAEDWYMNLSAETKASYDDLKAKFLNRFLKAENRIKLYNEFLSLEQGCNNVDSFVEKVMTCGRKLRKSDDEIMDKILHGLNPSLRQYVMLKEASNLTDVVKFAKIAEDINTNEVVGAISSKQTSKQSQWPWNQRRKPYHRTGNRHVEEDHQKDCHHCGRCNHDSSSCRLKNAKCFSCGKLGHIARICRSK